MSSNKMTLLDELQYTCTEGDRPKRFSQDNPSVVRYISVQQPRSHVQENCSLALLPNPVVQHILQLLQDTHPEDVLTVAEVCSFLYEQARYIQHQVVNVDLLKDQHLGARLDLIQHYGLLSAVRELPVERKLYEVPDECYRKILARLEEMIPYMTGLRDLHWDVSRHGMTEGVPEALLDSLPSQTRLHTSFFHWCHIPKNGSAAFRQVLARLVGCQNLYSLSLDISFEKGEQCAKTMSVLKDVLLSCPNLRRLPELRTRWCSHDGCQRYPLEPRSPYAGLGFADGERPAAAWEELGLGEYIWPSVGLGLAENQLRGPKRYRGHPVEACPEETYWAETFDWSWLVRLNYTPDCRFPQILFPKMVGLREFRLIHDWNQAAYEDIVALLDGIISPLEVLGLPRLNDQQVRCEVTRWLGAIARHGPTLRNLTLHTKNWCSWRDSDRGMTARSLKLLLPGDDIKGGGGRLPRLEELSLDLAWDEDGGWPYKALDVIARFPQLRRVELWFGLHRGYLHAHPHLTVGAARHLASYLRRRNPRLQRLVLHSGLGEWGTPRKTAADRQTPSPRNELNWTDFNCVSLVCEFVTAPPTGTDEDGGLIITCPELSRELNWRLRRLEMSLNDDDDDLGLRGERMAATDLNEKTLPVKVALDGPLSGAEWKAWCNQGVPVECEVERDRYSSTTPRKVAVRPWWQGIQHVKGAIELVQYVLHAFARPMPPVERRYRH